MKIAKIFLTFLIAIGLSGGDARAGVVINEIFYHAPDNLDDLEWIELHNPDDQAVDISGWHFKNGVEFKFPKQSTLPPRGFVLLCKDAKLFAECYDVPVAGQFKKSLGDGGDTVELAAASGKTVDRVKYSDGDPWPSAADGYASSLERITPGAAGDRADNWDASPLPEDEERPAGTPGRANASHSATFPPVIRDLTMTPRQPAASQPIRVQAAIEDSAGLATVELRYRVARPGALGEEQVVAMKASDGKTFSAEIPGQEVSQLLRLRVRAVNQKQAERFYPSPHGLRPTVSIFVQARPETANIPLAYIINTDPREFAEMERLRRRSLQRNTSPFNQEQWQIQELLQTGLILPQAWFEFTVRQPSEQVAFRKLKQVFAAKNTERNAIIEEALASDNAAEVVKTLPARIKAFQDTLIAQAKTALPAEKGAAFERWLREETKPREGGPDGFIRQLLDVEGEWFGLNVRVELTPAQVESMRPALEASTRGRDKEASTLQGPGGFGLVLQRLGEVEKSLNAAFHQHLTVRQQRALTEWQRAQGSPIRPRMGEARPRPPRGRSAYVQVDPKTGEAEVFDFIHVTERSAGYKVRFHKDRPLHGMTAANVIFEYNDRFLMAEPLAFELYRRVGNAACDTDFIRLSMNGHLLGYHLLVEQVNGVFLRRNRLDPGGDLYKILWYGRGLEGQHEKQNHPDRDHAALVKLVASLDGTSGPAQWEVIQKHFNVDQVMNYFAVNLVLSHWDGFFNNYFTLHNRAGGGKWEMYPWDQDKTWGFHDSSGDKVFFDMPVTFGMAGDRPPGGGEPVLDPRNWWRPGGYFSKPLLANSEFRRLYLQRVRKILEEVYTENTFFPVIDAMAERLKSEIPIRAKVVGEDPAVALARLDRNVASFKEHLVKRRQFLLAQEEIAKLPR